MTGPARSRELSLDGYRALLGELLDAGYQVVPFTDPTPADGRPALILRHDIDIDPALALGLAGVEHDLGVASTYLVLLTSPLYNPTTPANRATLAALADAGHEVGLHFDAAPYATPAERDAALAVEREVLGLILGAEVRVASFHRPGPAAATPELPGLVSAYEARFVDDLAYVTDSGGAFRYGHPLDSEAFAERRGMQLLTHPIWWSERPLTDVSERLDAWYARHQHRLRNTLGANVRPYGEHLSSTGDHVL